MTPESIEDVQKSNLLTNGLISCITKEDHPCHRPGMKEQTTDASCKEIPVRREDKPASYLARATRRALNIVPNDYDGMTVMDRDQGGDDCNTQTNNTIQEGCIYAVLSAALSKSRKEVFDLVVQHIPRNRWIGRPRVVERFATSLNYQARVRGLLHYMCVEDGTRTPSETTKGLLFQKRENLWYLRFND